MQSGGQQRTPLGPPKVLQCRPLHLPQCRPLHLPLTPLPKVSPWKVCRGREDADAQQEGPDPGRHVGKPSLGGRPGAGAASVKGSVRKQQPAHVPPGAGPGKQRCPRLLAFLGPHSGWGIESSSRTLRLKLRAGTTARHRAAGEAG